MNVVGGRKIAIAGDKIRGPRRVLILDDVLAISTEEVVFVVQGMIDAHIKGLGVFGNRVLENVVWTSVVTTGSTFQSDMVWDIGVRKQRDQFCRGWIDAIRIDDLSGHTATLPCHRGAV